MYLKSLVLKGFKSFADRSVLTLEPGLTVVVGPNGSGKSNISDAVLWVLGEQSAKQLRGQAMEDVIFAGSSARKAVGLAEVDLVLDNSDNTLPLDFDEVVITRRMYRSGDSEYLINGSPSRLMDVLDILNDSGLGRDAHSIISQGSLQDMLQAKPVDRRLLIEEAAGLLKHKKRKERSARKLKNMDAELTRVKDIRAEIERQLKPLERQASRAKQHEQLSEELRQIELALAVDDLRALQGQWQAAEKQEKEADTVVELAKYRVDERSAELEKYQRLLEEKGLFVGDINEQRRRCQLVLQRLDSGMLLLEEKGRNMVARLSELRQAIHRSDSRSAEAAQQLEAREDERRDTVAKREELYSQLSDLQRSSEGVRRERKKLDEAIGKVNSQVRNRQKAIDDIQLKIAKANEQLSTADVEDDLLANRRVQVDESLGATRSTLGVRRGRAAEVDEELSKLQRDSSLAKRDIDKRVRLLDDARRTLDQQRGKLGDVRAELKALEEVDRAFDAASPMLSWVIAHEEEVRGVVMPLNELFSAPPELEKLVEHLLGSDLFGLMMADIDAACALAEKLAAADFEGGGEISLVSLAGAAPEHGRAAQGERLLDLIECAPGHERVGQLLLGDVYLVGSVAEAVAAVQADASGSRFVTRDGVVVWPGGKITLGAQIADTDGVLSRKRRMNVLADEIPEVEAQLAEAEMAVSEAEHNLQLAQGDDFEISQNIAQLTGEKDSLTAEIGRLEQTITALMAESDQIEQRRRKIVEDTAAARERAKELAARKKELGDEQAGFEEQVAQLREERAGHYEQENEYAQRVQAVQVDLATVRERELHLGKQVDALQAELKELEKSLAVSHETERSLEILRLRVEPLYATFTDLREQVTDTAELLRDRANLEQAGQGDLRSAIEEAKAAVAQSQKAYDEAKEALTGIRIEKSKLEVRVETAIKTITEENGVMLDIALELPAPADRASDEKRAEKLRRRLKNLGAVNPVAVEEYRVLKERRDYLVMQLDDLEGAAKALQRIVAAIDRKMRNRFLETYEQVNANFSEIFAELFPGGSGHLELTEPDNPDETGVEVHAQPRGKAVRKQSLLSGGEQSLVAMALLFAVYRVRSTPFYILDEVEAALDDTNLRRLLSYLDGMRSTSQFIMISHQRRTMEMADLLYGVSMRSDGVSKLVSQRLDQAVRQARTTPATGA